MGRDGSTVVTGPCCEGFGGFGLGFYEFFEALRVAEIVVWPGVVGFTEVILKVDVVASEDLI